MYYILRETLKKKIGERRTVPSFRAAQSLPGNLQSPPTKGMGTDPGFHLPRVQLWVKMSCELAWHIFTKEHISVGYFPK